MGAQSRQDSIVAILAIAGIAAHLILKYFLTASILSPNIPPYLTLLLGGVPLVFRLIQKIMAREFGSDLLADWGLGTWYSWIVPGPVE